jgi:hypothetical protein
MDPSPFDFEIGLTRDALTPLALLQVPRPRASFSRYSTSVRLGNGRQPLGRCAGCCTLLGRFREHMDR